MYKSLLACARVRRLLPTIFGQIALNCITQSMVRSDKFVLQTFVCDRRCIVRIEPIFYGGPLV